MANPITNKVKKGKIPVIKKELDGGVVAEANNDGTIYLDKKIKKNSPKAKEAVAHEMVHMDQMARGDLNYDDNNVYWKGKKYPREIMNEGSKQLPWEAEAYNKTENMKKSKKSPLKISIGLSKDVLSQRAGMMEDELRMKADKHAAIGRAVQQVESRVPEKLGGGGTGSWKKGGTPMNSTNKDKSPIKVMPITNIAGSGSDVPSSSAADEVAAEAPEQKPESELVEDTQKGQNQQGGGDDKKPDNTEKKEEEKKEEETKEEETQEEEAPSTRVSYKSHSTASGYEKGYNEQAAKDGKSPLSMLGGLPDPAMDMIKGKGSPLKSDKTASEEAEEEISSQRANLEGKRGKLTTTKKTTKKRSQASLDFEANCYNADGSRKAEGTVVNGMTCSWASDEDYDPDSEYEVKTHVAFDDSFEPDEGQTVTPGTPDKYNMGYHESMDAKWGEGVRRRDKKQDARQATRDRNKYDRNYSKGYDKDGKPKPGKAAQRARNRIAGEGGEALSKDDYVKSRTPEQADYNMPVGKTRLGTPEKTEGTENTPDENLPTYEKDPETGKFKRDKKGNLIPVKSATKMGKNKSKSPFKQNGDKQLKEGIAEKKPTRHDSVVSASHHKHVTNKNPLYKDSFYDSHRKKAAKIAKKFPALDKYMKTEKGRASVGQGSANRYDKKKTKSAFKLKGWKAYNN